MSLRYLLQLRLNNLIGDESGHPNLNIINAKFDTPSTSTCGLLDIYNQSPQLPAATMTDAIIPDPSPYDMYNTYNLRANADQDGEIDYNIVRDDIDNRTDMYYEHNSTTEEEEDSDCDFDEVDKLRQWAISSNLSHNKLDELLGILRKRVLPELPKSAKTFLQTSSSNYQTEAFDKTSEFVYFGLEVHLSQYINPNVHSDDLVELLFNVDGIPLYKSSSKHFWPILCQIYHASYRYEPFAVAIYVGNTKPDNMNRYLEKFVSEMNTLQRTGINIKNKIFKISVKGFICDRPARSLIKCNKNHGGYFACERFVVKGKRVENRTVYPQLNCPLRTHESFLNQENEQHHTGISLLTKLTNIDMIKMFSLDFMHLGCLGVMKKLLTELWLGKKSAYKLSSFHKIRLSEMLISLKSQIPIEFQRTTRDINVIQKYKATEYRLFLLYVGPVVLKQCLTDN